MFAKKVNGAQSEVKFQVRVSWSEAYLLPPKNHRIDILTVVTLKARGAAEAKSGALTAVFGGHFTDNQRHSVLRTQRSSVPL